MAKTPPSGELVEMPKLAVLDKGVLSTAEVVGRAQRIQEIRAAVMKPGTHYGTIPGTPKPTLYQPGADLLLLTFKIAPKIANLEDLSTGDSIRYRVTVAGILQATGDFLGEGAGECSSDEEKYRWRKAIADEEWADTPADRRREKWARNQKPYKVKQIRTSPADVANTVLKMAVKRAKVAMALNVTAASDVFAQDLDDLSEELREQLSEASDVPEPPKPAQRASAQKAPTALEPEPSRPDVVEMKIAPQNIGVIVNLHAKADAKLLELDTGFHCSTRNPTLMQAAAELLQTKKRVELVCRDSSDPSRFAPILVEILPHPSEQSPS